MKLFISADIEGCCGVCAWPETERGKDDYEYARGQMTREVNAACRGALAAGAGAIRVKDAHDNARNILPGTLPEGVELNRGWTGDGFSMVSGLQDGFDALAFVGYHSPGGGDGNPLAHTMNTVAVDEVRINGKRAGEFHIHAYAAGMLGIPVIFLSGDQALCELAKELVPGITTVAVSRGTGGSSTSIHPETAAENIRRGMERAVAQKGEGCQVPMPEEFVTQVRFTTHAKAQSASIYPGAVRLDEKTVEFASRDYMDLLRFYHFTL